MKNNKALFILLGFMILALLMSVSMSNDLANKTKTISINNMNLAETVYKLGYQLFVEKRYAEADMVLRYWLCTMMPKEIELKEEALEILTSDEFYEYYSMVKVPNLLWLSTAIPDGLLLDKQSVKKKYLYQGNFNIDEKSNIWIFDEKGKDQIKITVQFLERRLRHVDKEGPHSKSSYHKW